MRTEAKEPSPEGKLDARTTKEADITADVLLANGPTGVTSADWHGIDWASEEESVRRLRQRIFKATRDGDTKKVRNLQKLMLRSRSNTLVSVKRVTQLSQGRKTAGIDGETARTPRERAELAAQMLDTADPRRIKPVKQGTCPLCRQALIAGLNTNPTTHAVGSSGSRQRRRCCTSITSSTGATADRTREETSD
ncbi:reverse transcriptase N-terminal domain-containing protein [Nocardia sp. NPDC052112]|uniref:reverse transcriptase N-terminal domain-containing protein n=1 Tax=Nocardia sp. NPDC052112 TaxID=3155646 RepID=UPI003443668B